MPLLKQLNCTVKWSDSERPLDEYGTIYIDGKVQCYVPVTENSSPFFIHLTSKGYIAPGLSIWVYMDGEYQCNRNKRNLDFVDQSGSNQQAEVDFKVRQKEILCQTGRIQGRPWQFEKLGVTRDHSFTEPYDSLGSADSLGTIEVVVLRCASEKRILDYASALGPPPDSLALGLKPKHWTRSHSSACGLDGSVSEELIDDEERKSSTGRNRAYRAALGLDGIWEHEENSLDQNDRNSWAWNYVGEQRGVYGDVNTNGKAQRMNDQPARGPTPDKSHHTGPALSPDLSKTDGKNLHFIFERLHSVEHNLTPAEDNELAMNASTRDPQGCKDTLVSGRSDNDKQKWQPASVSQPIGAGRWSKTSWTSAVESVGNSGSNCLKNDDTEDRTHTGGDIDHGVNGVTDVDNGWSEGRVLTEDDLGKLQPEYGVQNQESSRTLIASVKGASHKLESQTGPQGNASMKRGTTSNATLTFDVRPGKPQLSNPGPVEYTTDFPGSGGSVKGVGNWDTNEQTFDAPIDFVNKKSKSRQVRSNNSTPYLHRLATPTYIDDMDEPYASFIFKYREKSIVEKILGIEIKESEEEERRKYQAKSKDEVISELIGIKKQVHTFPKYSTSATKIPVSGQEIRNPDEGKPIASVAEPHGEFDRVDPVTRSTTSMKEWNSQPAGNNDNAGYAHSGGGSQRDTHNQSDCRQYKNVKRYNQNTEPSYERKDEKKGRGEDQDPWPNTNDKENNLSDQVENNYSNQDVSRGETKAKEDKWWRKNPAEDGDHWLGTGQDSERSQDGITRGCQDNDLGPGKSDSNDLRDDPPHASNGSNDAWINDKSAKSNAYSGNHSKEKASTWGFDARDDGHGQSQSSQEEGQAESKNEAGCAERNEKQGQGKPEGSQKEALGKFSGKNSNAVDAHKTTKWGGDDDAVAAPNSSQSRSEQDDKNASSGDQGRANDMGGGGGGGGNEGNEEGAEQW